MKQHRPPDIVQVGKRISDKHLGTVVRVKNECKSEEAFEAWQPIEVDAPNAAANISSFRAMTPGTPAKMLYRGWRPDEGPANEEWRMGKANPILGITQEPIPYGETGRVCINGLTYALMSREPEGWSNGASREWVHVQKHEGKWTLRNGPAGDAKVIQLWDYDDDYHAVLIDLCVVPNRVRFYNQAGETVPMRSIIWRSNSVLHADKVRASYSEGTPGFYPDTSELYATCGWDVAAVGYGWAYRFGDTTPVCITASENRLDPGDICGPVKDSFVVWPDLPGFRVTHSDWRNYATGDDVTYWVTSTREKRITIKMVWDSELNYENSELKYGYPLTNFGPAYDGTDGRPEIPLYVSAPALDGSSIVTHPARLNVAVDQEVQCSVRDDGVVAADPVYIDDPPGTVKIWNGDEDTIPQGWVRHTPLDSKLVRGADAGSEGGGTGGPYSVAAGSDYTIPRYRDVIFICRVATY